MTVEIPDFIARAIEAQGRVPLLAVETKIRDLEAHDWQARIAAGEPTLEDALNSREMSAEHIAPYAREIGRDSA